MLKEIELKWLLKVNAISALMLSVMCSSCRGDSARSAKSRVVMNQQEYANGAIRAKRIKEAVRPRLEAELKEAGLAWGSAVFLRIFKEERVLELWLEKGQRFELFATYPIAGMSGRLGAKTAEGDRQAPEGFYYVTAQRMKPDSRYHLAFNIGYPNKYDQFHKRTGSFIMVHGGSLSIGCFAMTDQGIEDIYTLCDAALKHGQPFFRVHSFPFRWNQQSGRQRMRSGREAQWHDFWSNLEEGFEWFEKYRVPPNVGLEQGRYVFSAP